MNSSPSSILSRLRKCVVLLFFILISCPKPQLKGVRVEEVPDAEFLAEAGKVYQEKPIYAYSLLKNVKEPDYYSKRNEMLIKLYLDQREYQRAAHVLDSAGWQSIPVSQPGAGNPGLSSFDMEMIMLNCGRWDKVLEISKDTLLLGLAAYRLEDYNAAKRFLTCPWAPHDYRLLYLAKAYRQSGDSANALATLLAIDSVSSYLASEYETLLFDLLLSIKYPAVLRTEMARLKSTALKEYITLKIYEKENDKTQTKKKAWSLIREYPSSSGAYYAVTIVKPLTRTENKFFGNVYYHHGEYDKAIKYYNKSNFDDESNYYLGRIHYDRDQYTLALKHFARSSWAAADYYRGRIYEDRGELRRAIAVYDSLALVHKKSSYANRALKRKAFALEDIGDTLSAVETFLKVKDRDSDFRAAMQLFGIGKLELADEIFKKSSDADFVYWQIRVKERLGGPTDSLKAFLTAKYPFSYYTLIRSGRSFAYDTLQFEAWLKQIGDTIVTMDSGDSVHLAKAVRYFELNEQQYAFNELEKIEDKCMQDLVYLIGLCRAYRADYASIRYCLQLKRKAENQGRTVFPMEFVRLLYPVRYALSISENGNNMALSLALIWQESLFDPKATSPANARGLMQIIPATGQAIATDLNMPDYSLHDPSISIKFGSYYFKNRVADFNSVPLALAAYNAGPIRVRKWVEKNPNAEMDEFIELIPYDETREYVKYVLARQVIYGKLLEGIVQQ